jgi:teichuronic acid biosynthesis glycosyltransferase TuaG
MKSIVLQPLVSVITPLFNSEPYIQSTIESVLNQTYTNWEMIIVDDCSEDKSAEIVLRFAAADQRIKYHKLEKNYGAPYAARNFATSQAKGTFIAFLDSDDLWHKEKLEKQISFMQTDQLEISFTAYSKIYLSDPAKKSKIITVPAVVNFKSLLKTNHIGCLTAIYDVRKVGKLFQPGPQYHEDYIMWLKTLRKGFKAYGLNEVLAEYRVHRNSISNNKIKMARVTWNIYRKTMELNALQSAWYFLNYSFNGIKKV